MSYEYVNQYYRINACTGRRVIAYGEPGVIAQDKGNYIGILLDKDEPGDIEPYHPIDGIEYLDEVVAVRQLPARKRKSKERYKRFLEYGDCFESFIDFCRWDASKEW